jgi:hypothetical protein
VAAEVPAFQAYCGSTPPRFANDAELECAKILDYYGVRWQYEPRTFVLETAADGRVIEAFTPDFYLPEQDCWIEVKHGHPSEREIFLMSRLVMGTRKDGYFLEGLRFPNEALVSWRENPSFEGISHASFSELPALPINYKQLQHMAPCSEQNSPP